jgi:hypothetical protein
MPSHGGIRMVPSSPPPYGLRLLPGDGERYDPRELCWWRETFRQVGVPVD